MRKTLLLAMTLLSSGCFSASYLAQAARGQFGILQAARPIPEVIADPGQPARTRRLLGAVPAVKAYGLTHGLKPTLNYGRYAKLDRPAAVWVVQACAPLSFDVKRWSFPIVGTVPYLGFFDQQAALGYAAELGRAGDLDVDVRTAGAYSTLGWFHDPVLSTMIGPGDAALGDLANVVLHESVHATLYVKHQSAFDESLASFVADRLTQAWLEEVFGPEAPEAVAWRREHEAEAARVARLQRAHDELDALYRSNLSDDAKRAAKARVLGALQRELHQRRPLNNAALAGFRTYASGTAAFERLLEACGHRWSRMLGALAALEEDDFGAPQRETFDDVIDRLVEKRCRP